MFAHHRVPTPQHGKGTKDTKDRIQELVEKMCLAHDSVVWEDMPVDHKKLMAMLGQETVWGFDGEASSLAMLLP